MPKDQIIKAILVNLFKPNVCESFGGQPTKMSDSSRGVVTWLLWSQIVSGHGVTTCVVKCGVVGPSGVLHAGVSKGESRQWPNCTPKAVDHNSLYIL